MTHPIRLPDFLCAGVEKCGTTTLYDLLKQHPDIGLSAHKETHFFHTHWDKGLDWYRDKFSHLDTRCLRVGEITPAYHRFPEVIPRIQKTLGKNIDVILMLREPRQRAFSHYIHDFARHQEITDLVYKRYLTTTKYAPILKQYFDAFGRDRCLVLLFEEDVLPNQQILMDKVCSFLRLPTHPVMPVHSNASCLPVVCWSPNEHCQLHFGHRRLEVPPHSLVIYSGELATTKVLSDINPQDAEALIQRVQHAVSFIPALKSSIIFDQNVKEDLAQVEDLLQRPLDIWRKPLGDLQARFAPSPEFRVP